MTDITDKHRLSFYVFVVDDDVAVDVDRFHVAWERTTLILLVFFFRCFARRLTIASDSCLTFRCASSHEVALKRCYCAPLVYLAVWYVSLWHVPLSQA